MHCTATDRQGNSSEVFWGEISPCEHLVQFYRDDAHFLEALEGFVAGGLKAGEGVVVVATAAHLATLEKRLQLGGIDLKGASEQDQYIALDAARTLSRFMIRGWPDDILF